MGFCSVYTYIYISSFLRAQGVIHIHMKLRKDFACRCSEFPKKASIAPLGRSFLEFESHNPGPNP